MKKLLPALALLISPLAAFPQASLVINGTSEVTIVEHGGTSGTPIYIVVANGNATSNANPGIATPTGSKGFIISENEFDKIKWNIGTKTGTYTIPFGYSGGGNIYYLPLSMNISAAGVGGTGMTFSTWHTQADDWTGTTSLTGPPANVTNMHAMYPGGSPSNTDNSYNTVSRFWTLDATSYTTPPTLSGATYTGANGTKLGVGIQFSFIDNAGTAESEIAPTGTPAKSINQSNLTAQRFNTGSHTWGDWLGSGVEDNSTTYTGTGEAFSGVVTSTNFYGSWTLSNSIEPLPIVLGPFSATCDNGLALIQWTSESEINNDHFTVLRTGDNVHFETVGTVQGAGNSSLPINYSLIDNTPLSGVSYYVLEQTDYNGTTTRLGTYEFNGCGSEPVSTVKAYNTTNYIEIQINSVSNDNYNIALTDMLGQTIMQEDHGAALGFNEIRLNNTVSPGIYLLSVRNDKVNYTKKLILGVR